MQRIGLVVIPGFQMLSLSALTVFETANMCLASPRYAMHVLSEQGGPVPSSIGTTLTTEPLEAGSFDTLLVGARMDVVAPTEGVAAFLRASVRSTRRIGSICIGAFTLGAAGLLDGRAATTHWRFASALSERYPRARVATDRIFTEDGPIWTSAGMATCVDMALGMVERDVGVAAARDVAKNMVLEHRRAGGQSQHSALVDLQPSTDAIRLALAHARHHLGDKLTVERLARVACLSPRQFARVFRAETGETPAKAIERLRLEAARLLAEQSVAPLDAIAVDTGFGDGERMRRAFVRALGETPQSLRSRRRASSEPRTPLGA